ncbi:DNA-protecting protein DprA [Antarcticibacterium arcticum]|uniref:DNA-protecting protein DprA n=1 Tax=Antarcticibacterium arcticum TaxID=2585771 RepID=A0A5B8YNR8_9FLAO|nr:DNA-processing protein DprA [Antarcticibacterium arcticum]QED38507.1 DNA-protecting protein DprA [Antarcticibacterium arcticum]
MKHTDLHYILALQNVPNLGDSTAKKLIRNLGSAEAVMKAKKESLLKIDGIGNTKLKDLHSPEHLRAAEEELKFIEDHKIDYAYFEDKDYPEKLKHCLDGPILLFSRGNIDLQNKKIISIVGTRRITTHGISFCEQLIEDLSPLNPVIVSGFAYGVDITAQKAAIKNNLQTIGCLAHGLNQIYPKVHSKYVAQIESNGGFYTDFWSSNPFERNNFLKRNRIIAGLSEATVVIESAEKGGSLVTADIANSYNREVFAVPGRPGDSQSKGCNNLIKSQNAHLITGAADLVYMLNWDTGPATKGIQKQLFLDLDPQEEPIHTYLIENGKQQLDSIALHCEIPTYKAAGLLLEMELKGAIRPLPGKLFEAI